MKLNKKFIAIPALALAAGLSLTACSSGGSSQGSAPSSGGVSQVYGDQGVSGSAPASAPATAPSSAPAVSPLVTACDDWDQAKVAGTTAEGSVDIQNAINVLPTTGTSAHLRSDLSGMLAVSAHGNVSWFITQVDQDCAPVVNGSSRSAS